MFLTSKKGFSLVELIAVCLMIGILASVAMPKYRRSVERARVAEARSLLRSIYDSCERLAWENQKTNCGAAIAAGKANFRKLDITVKGTFSENGLQLTTDNFRYILTSGSNTIQAVLIKGPYASSNPTLTFNGVDFGCSSTSNSGHEESDACKLWNMAAWNQE